MNRRLAVIPARSGSKRIPNKNVRNFCGRPMLSHILDAALNSRLFDEIHVSTDSQDIADLVSDFGVRVAFLRPAHLADDNTPIIPVLKNVLEEYLSRGASFDSVTLLMACAPMISAADLCAAVDLFDSHQGLKPVLCVAEYPCPVEWAFKREENGILRPTQPGMFAVRSQDLAPAYYDAGQFSVLPSQRVLQSVGAGSDKGFLGYPIQRHQAIDIDTMDDWRLAELIFSGISKSAEQN